LKKILTMIIIGFLCLSAFSAVFSIRCVKATDGSSQLPPVRVDNDGDGIDDNLEQLLAERFAPVIYISPDERNYPVNVNWFLAIATLEYYENRGLFHEDIHDVVTSPVGTQADLIGPPWIHGALSSIEPDPERFDHDKTFALRDVADEYKVGCLNPSDWKTYVHVYPNTLGGVNIQYWNVFSYNGFGIFALGFGNHGGDWDASIQVVLDSTLQPVEVWYSRHSHDHPGDNFPWDQVHIYNSTHPLVMIDACGHAAYKDMDDYNNYWGWFPLGSAYWRDDPDQPIPGWGTVWKTWTGGQVRQDPGAYYTISPNPGVTGGLVNVGEYNPGINQACGLLSGQFWPLNDQVFIQYSGLWGDRGVLFSGPRGPVFQGHDDGKYKSWYNQGAENPANPTDNPWRQAPSSTLSVGSPTFTTSATTFVSSKTSLTLTATQNAIATDYGSDRLFYRYYPIGSTPPAFSEYSAPFSLSGADGTYTIEYYSLDALNNQEDTHSQTYVLDNTPPTTIPTIGDPKYVSGGTYVSPDTPFTLTATDTGSGVKLINYRINSASYDSGWLTYTNPFNLAALPDGKYTISFKSTDNVENVEATHSFTVIFFSWNYIFQDSYGRGTTLKINLGYKFFQFMTPDTDYGIRKAIYMQQIGRSITIKYSDKQLYLYTVSVDTQMDFCYARAQDLQTHKYYLLIHRRAI
jgi:hypothetical protein